MPEAAPGAVVAASFPALQDYVPGVLFWLDVWLIRDAKKGRVKMKRNFRKAVTFFTAAAIITSGALYMKRNNMNERKLLKFRINSEEKLVTIDLTPLKAEGAGLNI
jgi:hypothetical protein